MLNLTIYPVIIVCHRIVTSVEDARIRDLLRSASSAHDAILVGVLIGVPESEGVAVAQGDDELHSAVDDVHHELIYQAEDGVIIFSNCPLFNIRHFSIA